MPDFDADRSAASEWARKLLEAKDAREWVIFDTETSDLNDAEILQIGLLWPDGTTALDTLIKPSWEGLGPHGPKSIPRAAMNIHGITDAMVADAPTLEEILPAMAEVMHGRLTVVYNVAYDFETLQGCLRRRWDRDRAAAWMNSGDWKCAMHEYARWYGEWNGRHGSYRWQRLPGGDHSAIGDCRATLEVMKRMAANA